VIKLKTISHSFFTIFVAAFITNACSYRPPITTQIRSIVQNTDLHTENDILFGTNKKKDINTQLAHNKTYYQDNAEPFKINIINFKDQFIGMASDEIINLLGMPIFIRRESPAEIWQYQSNICFIDIFFYKKDSKLFAKHSEFRSNGVKKTNNGVCFTSVLKR
jgi:hypothetical protein